MLAGFLGALADDVDLLNHGVQFRRRAVADVFRQLGPLSRCRQNLEHVVQGHLHLHEAGLNLDAVGTQQTPYPRGFAYIPEPHQRAFLDFGSAQTAGARVSFG